MKTLSLDSLREGKKQAREYLKANTNWPEKWQDQLISVLAEIDGTPTNKYVYILTKFWVIEAEKQSIDYNKNDNERPFFFLNYRAKLITLVDLLTIAEKKGFKGDVNNYKSYDKLYKDAEAVANNVTNSERKKGLSGLKKGRDYEVLYKGDTFSVFLPLNHTASRVIASDKVGSCEGKWCTAQNSSKYWVQYTGSGITLIYFVNYAATGDWLKFAVAVNEEIEVEAFDEKNSSIGIAAVEWATKLSSSEMSSIIHTGVREFALKIDEILMKEFPWILNAEIAHASYTTENGYLIWNSGIWIEGTWEDGTWEKGVWESGIWKTGVWWKGTWKNGHWYDGLWKNGVWKNGHWEKGIWKDGIWKDGWIYDPRKQGNFQLDWEWNNKYVRSPINPADYFDSQ